jgi:hypothetical protein
MQCSLCEEIHYHMTSSTDSYPSELWESNRNPAETPKYVLNYNKIVISDGYSKWKTTMANMTQLAAEIDSRGIDDSLSRSFCTHIHIVRCLIRGLRIPTIVINRLLAENDLEIQGKTSFAYLLFSLNTLQGDCLIS